MAVDLDSSWVGVILALFTSAAGIVWRFAKMAGVIGEMGRANRRLGRRVARLEKVVMNIDPLDEDEIGG